MEAEDLRAVTVNLNKGALGGDTGPVRDDRAAGGIVYGAHSQAT